MANIDAQLNTIRKAENGESVRDAIADAIDAVNRDGAVTLTKLTATHNGRWKAGDGTAYKEVSVNVEGGGSSSISMESFKVDIDTANGEYKASEVIGENKAWDTIIVDTGVDLESQMGEVTINEDGTYLPEDYGYSGFNKVIVSSTPTGDGPFTVNFWGDKNKSDLKQTQIVQKGTQAIYTGPAIPPSMEGNFIGWNPNPTYVTRDMDCVPLYSSSAPVPGAITDEWSTILANKGAPYAIGSYRNIDATIPYVIGNNTYSWRIYANIVKVAAGEQGTSSTWISTPLVYPSGIYSPGAEEEGKAWSVHPLRAFYNNVLFQNLSPSWQQSIKPVLKYSVEVQEINGVDTPVLVSTQDKIWIPCTKEMCVTTKVPHSQDTYSDTWWFFHQGVARLLQNTSDIFTTKYNSWGEIENTDGGKMWIGTNSQSMYYMKDYCGDNISVLDFFYPADDSKIILLRDGYNKENSHGYGPGLKKQHITGAYIDSYGLCFLQDFKEGSENFVQFCFCL